MDWLKDASSVRTFVLPPTLQGKLFALVNQFSVQTTVPQVQQLVVNQPPSHLFIIYLFVLILQQLTVTQPLLFIYFF